jgi:CubicO group peptidase (beta-lactamase class C family)
VQAMKKVRKMSVKSLFRNLLVGLLCAGALNFIVSLWSAATEASGKTPLRYHPPILTWGDRLSATQALLRAHALQGGFSGVALISKDAEKPDFFSESSASPFTLDSRFRIASLTKQFTATAILLLEQEGKLRLTDTACQHIEVFCQDELKAITLENLLRHTSGLKRDSIPVEQLTQNARVDFATYEQQMRPDNLLPLLFPPGSSESYSNLAYTTLGRIIEMRSGLRLDKFMRNRFFKPFRMNRSQFIHPENPNLPTDLVPGTVDGKPIEQDLSFIGRGGSGAIITSAGDLAQWKAAIHSGKLLNSDQTRKLFQFDENQNGLGWRWKRESPSKKEGWIWHNGGTVGYNSFWARDPELGIDVILLSNLNDDIDPIGFEIIKAMSRKAFKTPGPATPTSGI